jgi:hypothetical protein
VEVKFVLASITNGKKYSGGKTDEGKFETHESQMGGAGTAGIVYGSGIRRRGKAGKFRRRPDENYQVDDDTR